MKHLHITCFLALLFMMACSEQARQLPVPVASTAAEGDSTIYGLACEGTSDSILIYLRQPYTGADPDTFGVVEAMRRNQIFGSVRAGDQVAILPNSADSTVADIVIVTEQLLGTWCYRVLPTLRRRLGQEDMTQQQIAAMLTDSVRELLQMEREYGFTLKKDSVAFPVWAQKSIASSGEGDSPVEYPPTPIYRQWYIRNGHVLLIQQRTDSVGNIKTTSVDTTQLITLTTDTLVLRFVDGERGFYRKDSSEE